MNEVLNIENLSVSFDVDGGSVQAVRGVSLRLEAGTLLALVGESGCGKSAAARAILRLDDGPAVHTAAASLTLDGQDVLGASAPALTAMRGRLAAMVFQDPMTYLNPTMRVGRQVTEGLLRHGLLPPRQCRQEAVRLLEQVCIPDAALRARQYPHQLSGGMRQRVMLAMAMACEPKLLIADEPTTALDPTIQLQILQLLQKLRRETGTAILLITHDLSVVANMADTVAVMYGGKIVEQAPVERLFAAPAHPYTRGLLDSLPTGRRDRPLHVIGGAPPDLFAPPPGCPFAPRCKRCMVICREEPPEMTPVHPGHTASCWLLHHDCPKGGA